MTWFVVYFLHGDQLGSAALATTVTGTLLSQRRYLPYGETRWSSGPFPTDRRFTGQREAVTLGVDDYRARIMKLGRRLTHSIRSNRQFITLDVSFSKSK